MTGKDLLTAMSGIDGRYIEEAAPAAAPKRRSLRRPLLVAAAIAAALLLVGCGIVYALRLQDMSIGKATYTQRFDDKGKAIDPVEKSMDIITPYGRSGDAIQQALKEWYEFQESYDPDGALLTDEPDIPGIPNQYEYTYSCYTQEMVDKVDEIAAKYNLKLLRSPVEFESMSGFAKALGIDHILLPDSDASVFLDSGECYSQGNFVLYMDLNLPEEVWPYSVHTKLQYFRKDCLSTDVEYLNENEGWKEWMYTTASGAAVLILRAAQGRAYFVCDCGDAAMTVDFEAGFNPLTDMPDFKPEWMTDRQVEQIADAIDFTVRPTLPDASVAATAVPPAGWEIETTSVTFDGSVGRVVFHLTARRAHSSRMQRTQTTYTRRMTTC